MGCPNTHPRIIEQLCELHYLPGVGCGCASEYVCNNHFQLWIRTEREVRKLHEEFTGKPVKVPFSPRDGSLPNQISIFDN